MVIVSLKIHESQELIFHPITVLDSVENLNVLGLAKGANTNKNLIFQNFHLFTNISKSMMDQRLKFELIAAFDLLIMINCLDLDCGIQR